ncbi:MAG: twin-arginine translocation pathway signal protein, partial [Pseudomonadota bacterium]
MTLSRRKILSLIGGGAILSAAVPATGFVLTRTPHKALQPWALAGNYDDPRMNAMSYALLAPNPHNRQPWLAELIGKNQVDIYRDPQRDLPVTDPFARQLTIGMGCFLELMEMAAEGLGFTVSTALFPDGEEGPVARCRFTPAQPKLDPLFAYVANRRSHKEGFKAKAVGDERAERLSSYARVFNKGAEVDILKRIAHDAWIAEATTPAAWQESIDLLRIGKAEINSNPDGINVGGPML